LQATVLPALLLLFWPLLELPLPYRAVKLLHSTYFSAVLFQTDNITTVEPPGDRYRHLLLLLFIFSPASSRNPYARTVSSSLRKCIEHSLFCSAVGERTMTNPPPEKWQCHVCGTGPHIRETTPACTGVRSDNKQCGHKVCSECKRNNDIPSTLGTIVLRSPLTSPGTIDIGAMRRTAPGMAPRGNKRTLDHGQHHQQALRLGTRPSMAGWWICCCGQMNNPKLSGGRCTVCNHKKCGNCSPCT
jgi:hypothetical protein